MTSARQLAVIAIGALASFVYGIDYGYLGGVLAVPAFIERYGTLNLTDGTYSLRSDRLSLLTSTAYIGTFVGAFISPLLSARVGKKWGLLIGCLSFCVSGAIQLGAVNFEMFMVGRALGGIHIAFANIMGPSYVNEVAPKQLRGFGVVLCLQLVTFGNFFSSIVTLASTTQAGKIAYEIPISLCIIVGGLVAILLLFMPQTPLFLAETGKLEEAKASLVRIRGPAVPTTEVNDDFDEILEAIHGQQRSAGWRELFNKQNRYRTFLSTFTLVMMNIFTGCNFFLTYASVFMQQAGFTSPWGITVLISGTNCFTTFPALWLVERFGRRTLMAIGCVGCILANLGAGISYSTDSGNGVSSKLLVLFVTLYVFFFAAFYGPSGWAYSAEIPSQRLRSKTIAFGQALSTVGTWAVGYGSPYIFQDPINLKAGFCYVWLCGCVLCGVFNYFCLYETSGLSHAEIEAMLGSGNPARRSRAWGKQAAASRVVMDLGEPELTMGAETAGAPDDVEKKVYVTSTTTSVQPA